MGRQDHARVVQELRTLGYRLARQYVEREAGESAAFQGCQRRIDVDDGAARRVHQKRTGLCRTEQRGIDHPARFGVERHVQRHDVAFREESSDVASLDVRGKIPVDDVGIAGENAVEHVAADMRHPLSDPTEADDAERHVADPTHRTGRQVMPFACVDVAMVGDDVAHGRERQRERVRRDLPDTVIGRIRDPDAVPCAGVRVDRVEARAHPAHDAEGR